MQTGVAVGCCGVRVDSVPRGATVYVNGNQTEYKTPVKLGCGELGVGSHKISVMYEDGTMSGIKYTDVFTSVSGIVGSMMFPIPCLFIGIAKGFKAAKPRALNFNRNKAD